MTIFSDPPGPPRLVIDNTDNKQRAKLHNLRRKLIGMLTNEQLQQLAATHLLKPSVYDRASLVDMIQTHWPKHRTAVADAIANIIKAAE